MNLPGNLLRRHDPRDGFTLVEMLAVTATLAVLASLLAGGLLNAREKQKAYKSATTIRKLSEIILPYYETFETRRPTLPPLPQNLPSASFKEVRRIANRRLMCLELPDRFDDVLPVAPPTRDLGDRLIPNVGDLGSAADLGPLNAIAIAPSITFTEVPPAARRYRAIIDTARKLPPKPGAPPFSVSSAELLHLIVTRGPVADADIVAQFRPDEWSDSDQDGLPEFTDAWGRPIRFIRWPVGFQSPAQPIDGTTLSTDEAFSRKGHRLVPLIYSAGSDGQFDIADGSDNAVVYGLMNFDPFCYVPSPRDRNVMNCYPPATSDGAVNLVPVALDGRLVFHAIRNPPQSPLPATAFQAIGSERDDFGSGRVESIDNVTNHDLTR